MHSGMVMVDAEKMSKSLGNFFTIRDVLGHFDAETVRYFLLSSHYRSELNYTEEHLKQARASVERLYSALLDLDLSVEADQSGSHRTDFEKAMNDDFNTPVAYAVLFDLVREINRLKSVNMQQASALGVLLKELAGVLGLLQLDVETFFQGDANEAEIIEQLIRDRQQAREYKDWSRADEVRDRLQAMGIVLEDKAGKTRWRKI
jgi:cysteinyl-tRNA synthetase